MSLIKLKFNQTILITIVVEQEFQLKLRTIKVFLSNKLLLHLQVQMHYDKKKTTENNSICESHSGSL